MQQQNFPQLYSIKGLEEKFTLLDESHRAEGFMNLYYYTGSLKPGYLFNALAIPSNNYLAYFRLNIGLVEHYIRADSIKAASHHLKLAHRVVYYLADYEVNRHFAEYQLILKEKTKVEPTLHAFINPVDYDYREQFLASKSAAADLLKEAKEAITKERNRNHLFINWLAALLMLVILLLAFVFYGFKKLKQSTTYNNWITTALSHDLRSPIAHISNALNKPNGINQAKSNLINYEYLLDDTLSMAMHVQGNKTAVFKAVDLVELMDELLLDLQFIMLDKEIVIKNELPDDLTIKGDYAGLKVLFRNIVLNAIKHNKQKGFINIKAIVGPPLSVVIENSINAQGLTSTPSAGSQLIYFFSKQNKARYRFKKQNDVALSEVKFI
jgi:signal transduction histidine kinase